MRRFCGLIVALALAVATTTAWAQQEVEFNYNGRVHVAGSPFSGTGYFKFSLVTGSPETTIWANDGTALDGSEPSSSIATTVTQGFFSVDIGDTSVPNMAALNPTLFNREDKVYLRSWFSDGTHGFEQMHPDRRVVNPALLGSVGHNSIDLYVNPSSGDDAETGLSSSKAKATIQAAWDALPGMIVTSATIHLAAGTYRQSALLTGRVVVGDGTVRLLGNPDSPLDVILTGADEPATGTAVREIGLHIRGQQDVVVQGITLQYYQTHGMLVERNADAIVRDCIVRFCPSLGIEYANFGVGNVERVEFYGPPRVADGAGQGMGLVSMMGVVGVSDCHIHDLASGIIASEGRVAPIGNTITNCYKGLSLTNLGLVYPGTPATTISYCHYGIHSATNSVLANKAAFSISNSYGSDIFSTEGAIEW